LSIFIIDFSINAVQAMDRALIVDALPRDAQELGNAWASRMIGAGHVLGFFMLDRYTWLSVFDLTTKM
jgi:solute carrier family 45 protein 1/2/4